MAERRPLATSWPSRRPALRVRNPAWEILAGALLLVGWALLWSFFLDAVVEPSAAQQREAGARAAALTARGMSP